MEPARLVRPATAPPESQDPRAGPRGAQRRRLALIVDPRFPGGTCAAVAAEIRALGGLVDLSVHGVETAMFKGRRVNPTLQGALDEQGIGLTWSAPVIRADTVVFHNPSCLRFDTRLATRISCASAFIVTQENLLRPNGSEGFDVATCLDLIDAALVSGHRNLAPVSPYNRRTVDGWLARNPRDWTVTPFDWLNICELEIIPPASTPRDRRGRHSRPGFEKFPPLDTMLAHFPPHAERCAILGGDSFLLDPETLPRHWTVRRFGETDVAGFLAELDFFVYFTHPQWRESFGRVIAEAIAAGKLVITDPGTAEAFGDAVVPSDGTDVDRIIQAFIAEPRWYQTFVRSAQASLARFRPEACVRDVLSRIDPVGAASHALL